MSRQCPRCHEDKMESAFRAYTANGYHSVRTICRPCERAVATEAYQVRMSQPGVREARREYDSAYRKKNRQKIRARMAVYMKQWRQDQKLKRLVAP